MATPQRTARPGAAPKPRRRRWRGALALFVLAVLVGRGFGWLGGGGVEDHPEANAPVVVPSTDAPSPAPAAQPAAQPASAGAAGAAAGAAAAQPAPEASAPPPKPLMEVAANAPASQPEGAPEPAPAPGLEPDRFGSLLSVLAERVSAQQFGAARALSAKLLAMPLDRAQRAEVATRVQELDQALTSAVHTVHEALAAGQVLTADAALTRLLAADQAHVLPLVAALLREHGSSGDLDHLPPQDGAPWPLPRPLPKQRAVRTVRDGTPVVGRVVDSRAERLTLRLETAGAVTFPAVPVVDCEPVDATAAEALEMAFAALHANRARLARLWLAAAAVRGGAAPAAERLQRLRELLR